jgi:hypothetical protein
VKKGDTKLLEKLNQGLLIFAVFHRLHSKSDQGQHRAGKYVKR